MLYIFGEFVVCVELLSINVTLMLPSQPSHRHHAQLPHLPTLTTPLAFFSLSRFTRRQVLPLPSLETFHLRLSFSFFRTTLNSKSRTLCYNYIGLHCNRRRTLCYKLV